MEIKKKATFVKKFLFFGRTFFFIATLYSSSFAVLGQ
jgi:hypothetical protein